MNTDSDNQCDREQDMCNLNNNIPKIELKESDFSIDHILNRAGERCTNLENCSFCPQISLNEINLENSQLNWLQYTRYHPPKLTRSIRHTPAKRIPGRLPRIPFTSHQLSTLEEAYKMSTYLSSEDASKLAEKLNLTSIRVKIWYQNRRARERREQKLNQHVDRVKQPYS